MRTWPMMLSSLPQGCHRQRSFSEAAALDILALCTGVDTPLIGAYWLRTLHGLLWSKMIVVSSGSSSITVPACRILQLISLWARHPASSWRLLEEAHQKGHCTCLPAAWKRSNCSSSCAAELHVFYTNMAGSPLYPAQYPSLSRLSMSLGVCIANQSMQQEPEKVHTCSSGMVSVHQRASSLMALPVHIACVNIIPGPKSWRTCAIHSSVDKAWLEENSIVILLLVQSTPWGHRWGHSLPAWPGTFAMCRGPRRLCALRHSGIGGTLPMPGWFKKMMKSLYSLWFVRRFSATQFAGPHVVILCNNFWIHSVLQMPRPCRSPLPRLWHACNHCCR